MVNILSFIVYAATEAHEPLRRQRRSMQRSAITIQIQYVIYELAAVMRKLIWFQIANEIVVFLYGNQLVIMAYEFGLWQLP